MTRRHGKMIQKMCDISSKMTKNDEEENKLEEINSEQKLEDSELNEAGLTENLVYFFKNLVKKFSIVI